jgi:hypothetical protein
VTRVLWQANKVVLVTLNIWHGKSFFDLSYPSETLPQAHVSSPNEVGISECQSPEAECPSELRLWCNSRALGDSGIRVDYEIRHSCRVGAAASANAVVND